MFKHTLINVRNREGTPIASALPPPPSCNKNFAFHAQYPETIRKILQGAHTEHAASRSFFVDTSSFICL